MAWCRAVRSIDFSPLWIIVSLLSLTLFFRVLNRFPSSLSFSYGLSFVVWFVFSQAHSVVSPWTELGLPCTLSDSCVCFLIHSHLARPLLGSHSLLPSPYLVITLCIFQLPWVSLTYVYCYNIKVMIFIKEGEKRTFKLGEEEEWDSVSGKTVHSFQGSIKKWVWLFMLQVERSHWKICIQNISRIRYFEGFLPGVTCLHFRIIHNLWHSVVVERCILALVGLVWILDQVLKLYGIDVSSNLFHFLVSK